MFSINTLILSICSSPFIYIYIAINDLLNIVIFIFNSDTLVLIISIFSNNTLVLIKSGIYRSINIAVFIYSL